MSRLGDVGGRLYRGDVSINFVGRQKLWYTISGCILVIAIVALLVRGLNFSVEFKGGSVFQVKAPNATISQVEKAVIDGGGGNRRRAEGRRGQQGRSGRPRPRR